MQLLIGDRRPVSPVLRAITRLPRSPSASKTSDIITGPDGQPLDDILDEDDNAAVADFITEEVRALDRRPERQPPRLDRRRAQDDGVLRRLCAVAVRARSRTGCRMCWCRVARVAARFLLPRRGARGLHRVHLGRYPRSSGCADGARPERTAPRAAMPFSEARRAKRRRRCRRWRSISTRRRER